MRKHPRLVSLGKQIRTIRDAKGYTQEGFANEVGLDRSYYGGLERGERNAAALNLMKIAEVLKVEPGQLFPSLQQIRRDKS